MSQLQKLGKGKQEGSVWAEHLAMHVNKEPPKWLVDMNPLLNDVFPTLPYLNSETVDFPNDYWMGAFQNRGP